jgi:protein disulfide-isomerase
MRAFREMRKSGLMLSFLAGIAGGVLLYHACLILFDKELAGSRFLQDQQSLVEALQLENQQLWNELFQPRIAGYEQQDDLPLPYDPDADASADVLEARSRAKTDQKFLMVTFGANWCQDCRNLHRTLHSEVVESYTQESFLFVNVDVGKFNQNREIAEQLGVSLKKGIPVAVFFDPEGKTIGTTNEGELEPARYYSSRQILKFIRDVAERSHIQAPDAVH